MLTDLNRIQLGRGVFFTAIQDKKFRHNRLSANLVVPMRADTVTEYALLSYLLRRSTADCPDFTRFNRRLDALYGASLDCDVSKISANQVVTFSVSFIDDAYTMGNESLTKQCAELLCEVVTRPHLEKGVFPKADLDIERKNLIDSIQALINDKRGYAISACRELMGRGEEASLRKYGTVERAQQITQQSLTDAYHRLLREAQIELLFIGAGDGEDAMSVAKEAFATLQRSPLPLEAPKRFTPGETPLTQTERMDVTQSKLVLGFRMLSDDSPKAQAAARVMTALYGGTPSSKLFVNVREKLSLCYYCAARYDRSASVVMVDSGVESENIERAKSEILAQLADVSKGDFDAEMLENTKNLLKTAYLTVEDSISSMEDWYLQRILTNSVATPAEELSLLLAVTAEEVAAAAKATKPDAVYLLTGKEE